MKVRIVKSRLTEAFIECEYEGAVRQLDNAASVFSFLADRATEEFWILMLDGRHKPIALSRVSQGTMMASLVHPREVFGPALRMGAAAIIVAHNHPSGDPAPSSEDRAITKRLDEVGKLVGITLLDHVVIGDGRHASAK